MQPYILTQDRISPSAIVPDMPTDYADLAKLDWLGYGDPTEMLAERFHMDESCLGAEPGRDFRQGRRGHPRGAAGREPAHGKVAKIDVDKAKGELIAYGDDDKLILALPGHHRSAGTPSPDRHA